MTTPQKERITATIMHDPYAEDPRENNDYLMTYFSNDGNHRSCKGAINPTEHYCMVCGLEDSECRYEGKECSETDDNIEVRYSEGIALALRVYHNHRMGDMSADKEDPEDGAEGYIYLTKEKYDHEYGDDPEGLEKAERVMRWELKELSAYASGDVWGYKIEKHTTCDCCGEEKTEEIDSCWGFYGNTGEVLHQIIDNVGDEYEELLREAAETPQY